MHTALCIELYYDSIYSQIFMCESQFHGFYNRLSTAHNHSRNNNYFADVCSNRSRGNTEPSH